MLCSKIFQKITHDGSAANMLIFLSELSWPYCSWDSHCNSQYINPAENRGKKNKNKNKGSRDGGELLFSSSQFLPFILLILLMPLFNYSRKEKLLSWYDQSWRINVTKMLMCIFGTSTCIHDRTSAESWFKIGSYPLPPTPLWLDHCPAETVRLYGS